MSHLSYPSNMQDVGPSIIALDNDDTAITLSTPFTSFDSMGVTIITVTASISLVCVMIMFAILALSMWKRRTSPTEHFFVRTHAAAYFGCLLVADVIQAVGTLMSIKWVKAGGITLNSYCSAQGAIKNAGNLSISLWTLMLAIHAFSILYLRCKPQDWVLYTTVIGVWLLVGFIVVIGPAAIQKAGRGPYFGISGFWCWISDPYPVERITLEYIWMLGSAGISFILYTLTFLRLRGNIVVQDGKPKFRMINSKAAWKYQVGRDSAEIQMTTVAKSMIGYPVLFSITVFPIAICRFIAWTGKPVPMEATIFSDAVFSLTGVFDLILFVTARSLLPARGILPSWFYPRPRISDEVLEHGVQPYHVQDFASAHGFNQMYQSKAERSMVTLPPRISASFSRAAIPSRPSRPLSLVHSIDSFLPPIPGDRGNRVHRNPSRMTTKTGRSLISSYSQDDTAIEYPETPSAWDDIDLEPRVTPPRTNFRSGPISPVASKKAMQSRDTQYTTFTLSAYQMGGESNEQTTAPRMPIPSGAGIDLSAGRYHAEEDDEQFLVNHFRASYASSMSYDLRSPQAAVTRI